MIPTAVLTKLATLGLSEAQAEAVAGMLTDVECATKGEADAVLEKGREKVRARVQKWRAKQPVTLPNVTERYVTAHASASLAPDLENKQTNKEERKQERAPAAPVGFSDFWALFPNKVGKRDAEREFGLALQRSSFDEIMAGLRRYVGKRDDRPWCNPSTFLHQNRWEDQPADVAPRHRSTSPPAHQGDGYNAVLNGIINGKTDVEYPGTTIDASYDRTDRGSSANLVQFDALSKGYRS